MDKDTADQLLSQLKTNSETKSCDYCYTLADVVREIIQILAKQEA